LFGSIFLNEKLPRIEIINIICSFVGATMIVFFSQTGLKINNLTDDAGITEDGESSIYQYDTNNYTVSDN
jgi:hypothetical protein